VHLITTTTTSVLVNGKSPAAAGISDASQYVCGVFAATTLKKLSRRRHRRNKPSVNESCGMCLTACNVQQ
jgi:hypothetical protein